MSDLAHAWHGEGTPLVLIAGLGGKGTSWHPFLESAAVEYRVLTFDNRGTGASPPLPGPIRLRELALDVVRLLDHLHVERAAVVGRSMGGMIAQELALLAPERVSRLVLACTAGRSDPPLAATFRLWSRMAAEGVSPELRHQTSMAWCLGQEFRRDESRARAYLHVKGAADRPRDYALQAEACAEHDALERIGRVCVPTLVISGTADLLTPPRYARELAGAIPKASLCLIPGAGHLAYLEKPERFAREVLDFLAASHQRGPSVEKETAMTQSYDALVEQERRLFAPGVRRWPLALARGEGSRVWDVNGAEFVDLTAGWGVTAIGHSHPALIEAITDQAKTLMQTTNIVYSEPQLELAERLDRITPNAIHRSFFVASGAEANEGALKLAHRKTGRSHFVATLNSFHGRTLGVLGCLGQAKYRDRWKGIIREAELVPYGDLAAAEAAIRDDVAAMIVEPVQGEGGVAVPGDDYLPGLARICHASGALLILDEIQTGIGRTGRWLAREHSGVIPDILTLGKGLGGGLPIAAFMATEQVMSSIEPGDHGGTYAGNLLCARGAATVLRVIEDEGLVPRAAELGEGIMGRLRGFGASTDKVEEVRGLGLLIGLVLRDAELAVRVHTAAREAGVLVNLTADRVIRIFPALNIPQDELDRALDTLESTITQS